MAELLCPNCGTPNPDEGTVCSFCGQPLLPVAGESIRPGETPTKKITSELEPILPQWLREARETARRAAEEAAKETSAAASEAPSSKDESPDWLAGLESVSREAEEEEIPDWLRGAAPPAAPSAPEKIEVPFPRRQEIRWEEETEEETGPTAEESPSVAAEGEEFLPPWLRGVAEESSAKKDEIADWLAGQQPAPAPQQSVSPFPAGSLEPPSTGELTDWLDKAMAESTAPGAKAGKQPEEAEGDWLSSLPRGEAAFAPADSEETFGADLDLPDWLKSAGPPAPAEETPSQVPLPDWMASLREPEAKTEPPAKAAESTPQAPRQAAFVSEEGLLEQGEADELFSIELPDWLSKAAPAEEKAAPQGGPPPEAIAPAELPSWVQAMRPVETVLPGGEAALPPAEGPLEESGPLAGLRGVLPRAGELIQPGKPRPQGMRLQVNESQQADAALLEQMLAAETQAKPIRSEHTLSSQRILRWALSALLILLAALSLLSGSQSVPLPAALPPEAALGLPVLDALPQGAPVLMIFDYEPALAGEVEAAAAPFVDRMLGLASPRVTVLSTSPTGAALAERFFAKTQARHNYRPGRDYVNLGYLPGGEMGIRAFAENPRAAMPSPQWESPAAQEARRFADYAAVLLLTDQAAAARAWVEQTEGRREGRPLLIVSSAQAAPMIQPYLLSGQVNGLVSGLHGGAAFEAFSGLGSPVRRYWDAYHFVLLFAVVTVVIGSLWNVIAAARSRRQGLDEA